MYVKIWRSARLRKKIPSGYKITSAQKLLIVSVYATIVKAARSSLFPDKALRSAVKKTAEQVGLNY